MKEIAIPIGIFGFITLLVIAILVFYFRLLQHRTEISAMTEYRNIAEQSLQQQKRLETQLTELTARMTAVEQLLRTVE